MKRFSPPLLAAFATATFSGSALAANSADVHLFAQVTPASCDLSLTGGADFDYGSVGAGELSAGYKFEVRSKDFVVDCKGANTPIRIALVDSNPSANADKKIYPGLSLDLGLTAPVAAAFPAYLYNLVAKDGDKTVNVGVWGAKLSNMQYRTKEDATMRDAYLARPNVAQDPGVVPIDVAAVLPEQEYFAPRGSHLHIVKRMLGVLPAGFASGSYYTGRLSVQPALATTAQLPDGFGDQVTQVEGLATLRVDYGI